MDQAPKDGLSGIMNLGNTCFMNSVIQCLSHTTLLRKYLLDGRYKSDANQERKEYCMLVEMYKVLEGLWEDRCIIKPISFKRTLSKFYDRYQGWRQHDSHEVLIALIDMLHLSTSYNAEISAEGVIKNELDKMKIESIKRWNTAFKNKYSFIIDNFYGQFHSEMYCPECKHSSHTYDPFCTITVPIVGCGRLEETLDLFTQVEQLDDNNKWKCDTCKKDVNARKRLTIWMTPNILVITLKRFNHQMRKINRRIEFPVTKDLNIRPYVSSDEKGDCTYELYAVNNHRGGTNGGHYFTYAKCGNGQWYVFNDATVSPILRENLERQIISPSAYILFYRKRHD